MRIRVSPTVERLTLIGVPFHSLRGLRICYNTRRQLNDILGQMKKSFKRKTEECVFRKINRQRSQYWKMVRRLKSEREGGLILPVDGLV